MQKVNLDITLAQLAPGYTRDGIARHSGRDPGTTPMPIDGADRTPALVAASERGWECQARSPIRSGCAAHHSSGTLIRIRPLFIPLGRRRIGIRPGRHRHRVVGSRVRWMLGHGSLKVRSPVMISKGRARNVIIQFTAATAAKTRNRLAFAADRSPFLTSNLGQFYKRVSIACTLTRQALDRHVCFVLARRLRRKGGRRAASGSATCPAGWAVEFLCSG
jgi:hypothetical protein